MELNPMKWKVRTILYCSLSAFLFYALFIYKKQNLLVFEGFVKNAAPKEVWSYMSDFSYMRRLNPTIEYFNIIDDSTEITEDYESWKYTVEYIEHLTYLPMIRHIAIGHYIVKNDKNGYDISSTHRTCFFINFGCYNTTSQVKFEMDDVMGTKYIETIQYECQIAFSPLCFWEIMYQRKAIQKRLSVAFRDYELMYPDNPDNPIS